jgi:antirestriction protein ArdC
MNVNEVITQRFLDSLEKGIVPWKKPWSCSKGGINFNTIKEYKGINRILTGMSGFSSPYWLTFKQVGEREGSVKAGSKGTPIIFFTKGKNEDEEKTWSVMRYYTVFNAEQINGIEFPATIAGNKEKEPIETAEKIIDGFVGRPEINFGGNKACYVPALDIIKLPTKNTFLSSEHYYNTFFRELVHSTGHTNRLNREGVSKNIHFGSDTYSKEELVAEIGASFLCNESGILDQTIENSEAYIQNWTKHLKENANWIISAAARAQKGYDWIMGRRTDLTA